MGNLCCENRGSPTPRTKVSTASKQARTDTKRRLSEEDRSSFSCAGNGVRGSDVRRIEDGINRTMSYHQYISRLDTDKERVRKLIANLVGSTLSVWMIDDHAHHADADAILHKLCSEKIENASSARFLSYAGVPLLAVSVSLGSDRSQVQLWEIVGLDRGAQDDVQLCRVSESKAGIHTSAVTSVCCAREIIFSADKHELKTWILEGWEKNQWLVQTHAGRPEKLKLTNGALHRGIDQRIIGMYATYFPLGKPSNLSAGRFAVGASTLFTCSKSCVRVWKILRSGGRLRKIDLDLAHTLTVPSHREEFRNAKFTGHVVCTNPYRGSQWYSDAVSSCDPYNEVHSVPQLAHREKPHMVFVGVTGPSFDGVVAWQLGGDTKTDDRVRVKAIARATGRILALTFGPYGNGPLVASTRRGTIEIWSSPFEGRPKKMYDDENCVRSFVTEPNIQLWGLRDSHQGPSPVEV